MYSEPLFIERLSSFEKVAVTVRLPDDESKWAPIVLSELHRQAPMMRDFHSEITLDRTDVNKGLGFGYISCKPKTANPLAASGLPSIKIPVFIKNWHLSPIDVFFDSAGRGYFLSERRIREVLARPQLGAGAVDPKDPVSGDIRTMLTPPWENVGQFYRGINTNVSQNAQIKTSSILSAIDGTVDLKDTQKLASWVSSDEGRSMMWGQHDVLPVFSKALRLEAGDPLGGEKVASRTGSPVVQFRWDGGPNMLVKVAQPGGFAPQQGQVPAAQATQQMTPAAQAQLAQGGQATQADQMQVMSPEELDGDDFQPVSQFGIYRVITVNNEQLMGWVFPFILSFKMEKVPQQIFTDGSNFAVQQAVSGVHVATNSNLPIEQPQGRGFFYIIRNGRAFAFAPIDLQGEQQQPDGNIMYMAQTLLGGNQVQIMKIEGMKAAAEMGENQFALPGDVKWCSFKQRTNPLIEDPMQAGQRAGAYTLMKIQQKAMLQQQALEAEAQKGKKGQKKTASLNPYMTAAAGLSAAAPALATYRARKKMKDRGYTDEEARSVTGGYGRNAVQGLTQGAVGMSLAGHIGGGKGTKTLASLAGGGARSAQILQDTNKFMLEDRARRHYMRDMDKYAGAPITAVVRATQDNTYTLSGNAFEKLAHEHTRFLDYADTEWMLALAGVDPEYTQEKLASIHVLHRGRVEIPVLRPVTPPETTFVKTAALEKVCTQLSRMMAKHANEIRDPNIADKLLALNFLNPRNVSMFINYLPTFEETTSNLANLLVASRLGEKSLDEGACKEALRNLEDVLTGLKMLAMTRESV